MDSFSITKTIKAPYPKGPYEEIKNEILGNGYHLSLTFVGTQRAKTLNQKYRNKTYTPNVLSFPLEKNYGEVFITPEVTKKESGAFGMTPAGYVLYLFIHACLHLKGHHHGATMERAEKRYCNKYHLL